VEKKEIIRENLFTIGTGCVSIQRFNKVGAVEIQTATNHCIMRETKFAGKDGASIARKLGRVKRFVQGQASVIAAVYLFPA
jgi:hypothetical protein